MSKDTFQPLPNVKTTIKPPIRATVRAVLTIAAECIDLADDVRTKYARAAGIQPVDGKYALANTYDSFTVPPKLARELFVNFPAEYNEDELNEGEVWRAFNFFMMQRSGI